MSRILTRQTLMASTLVALLCIALLVVVLLILGSIIAAHASQSGIMLITPPFYGA